MCNPAGGLIQHQIVHSEGVSLAYLLCPPCALQQGIPVVPAEARRVIKGRGLGIGLHPSFNRPFRDPLSKKGSWQIEDFARAVECFFPLLFRPMVSGNQREDVLPENIRKPYGHLLRFALFHMKTDHSFKTWDELWKAAAEAHNELLGYGKAAEKVGWSGVQSLG